MTPRLVLTCLALLGGVAVGTAQAAQDCSVKAVPQPLPSRPTALPPLSSELPGSGHQLGAPDGVLAYTSNEVQSVDRVLLRLRQEGCQNISQAAGYVPRTKWDNTPWRFNAGGEGKKFSAAEFSAWMESRGVHVAKGSGAAATVQPVQAQPEPDQQEPKL